MEKLSSLPNKKSSDSLDNQTQPLVLPPVEGNESSSNTHSLVFDLLQLANSCSRETNGSKKNIRRYSLRSGENYRRPTISTIQKRNGFESSFNSVPETHLKQKKNNLWLKSTPNFSPPQGDDQNKPENSFSQSWPLSPVRWDKATNQLPKLPEKCTASKLTSDTFSNHLNKFNKSRAFRMNDVCKNERKTDIFTKSIFNESGDTKKINEKEIGCFNRKSKENLNEINPFFQKQLNNLRVTGTFKKLTSPKIKLQNTNKSISKSSNESYLTNVTKEIEDETQHQENKKNFLIQQNDEVEEVRQKCIRWLEGIAKERLLNPNQIFLPHLLMP